MKRQKNYLIGYRPKGSKVFTLVTSDMIQSVDPTRYDILFFRHETAEAIKVLLSVKYSDNEFNVAELRYGPTADD